jgi:hypothetical protein
MVRIHLPPAESPSLVAPLRGAGEVDPLVEPAAYPMLAWRWFIELPIRSPIDERMREGDGHPARLLEQDAVDAASEPVPGLRRRVSGDGQVGHQDLSSCLRAQQHGDKEDGQAHHRGDENRTRQPDLVGGRV